MSENGKSFEILLGEMGEVGGLLHGMHASEGGAGNITVMCELPGFSPEEHGLVEKTIQLPLDVPELAGRRLLVTGSGCRLRDLAKKPLCNLGVVEVLPGGRDGRVYYLEEGRFRAPTTEYNTHLRLIQREVRLNGSRFFAVLHAQPLYLTYLTHIPAYQETMALNRALYRWQAEQIVFYPYGVAYIPFVAPGSDALMELTNDSDSRCRFIIWGKHGVVSLSDESLLKAQDSIEYFEAAAQYEYLDLSAGGPAEGLSNDELREICDFKGVTSELLDRL